MDAASQIAQLVFKQGSQSNASNHPIHPVVFIKVFGDSQRSSKFGMGYSFAE
jgi:hypothetical protein